MKHIHNQQELKDAIAELERKKAVQQMELKSNMAEVKVAVQPQNLLKNTFSEFAQMPEVRKMVVSTVVGFALGYVAKKAEAALSEESLDKTVSGLIGSQMGKLEQKNPDSFLLKAFHYFRTHLRKDSKLYPLLHYNE